MSRLSLFNSPLLLGFDHFERALDRVSKVSTDGYPPYNIEQLGENALRITLAVAGFTMRTSASPSRTTSSSCAASRPTRATGLSASRHRRAPVSALFVLAEGIEVNGAWLDNGLLHIDLIRPEIESRVRTVEIRSGTGDVRSGAGDVRSGAGADEASKGSMK